MISRIITLIIIFNNYEMKDLTLISFLLFSFPLFSQTDSCNCSGFMSGVLANPSCTDSSNSTQNPHPEATRYCYGPKDYNWFDFYEATDSNDNHPTTDSPLFIWAHENLGFADGGIGKGMIWSNVLDGQSIHFLSWESVVKFESTAPEDLNEAHEDFELIMQIVKNQASNFNIDLNQIYIGGQSRGSIASWIPFCLNKDDFAGGYFTQAHPNGSWEFTNAEDWVNKELPQTVLLYKHDLGSSDFHDPVNGKLVIDEYTFQGLDIDYELYYALDTVHSSGSKNAQLYVDLLDFINGNYTFATSHIEDAGLISGPYDRKDARCIWPLPLDGTEECFELSLEKPINVDWDNQVCTSGSITVDLSWEKPSSWSSNFSGMSDGDSCYVRYGFLLDGVLQDHTIEIIDQSLLDADQLGLTSWEVPSEYHCPQTPAAQEKLAFQVKCIVDYEETPWSDVNSISRMSISDNCGCLSRQASDGSLDDESNSVYTVEDEIYIISEEFVSFNFELYNLMGQLIKQTDVSIMGTQQIFSGIPAGIYIVRYSTNEGKKSDKVIITN